MGGVGVSDDFSFLSWFFLWAAAEGLELACDDLIHELFFILWKHVFWGDKIKIKDEHP